MTDSNVMLTKLESKHLELQGWESGGELNSGSGSDVEEYAVEEGLAETGNGSR